MKSYFPAYMKLRRRGHTPASAIAVMREYIFWLERAPRTPRTVGLA